MGQYNQAVITSAGQGLLAGVIASGKSLAFTNAKTSTRIYSSGLEALTSIADVMQTDAVSSATVMSNSQVKISTRFTNEDITAAYDINTIGIFAKADGDASDTLFAVITAVTPDSMPKYTSSNPVAYIYDVTIGMSNAQNITLVVSPTGTPSYGDLAAAQTAAENASAANLAPAYDSTATYAKDDFCVNGGKLYQCNADISTAEAFNPAHWTEVKVTEVMGGGGGVTPEIMAQIENAQWKTESEVALFNGTATTALDDDSLYSGELAVSSQITADIIVVTFEGKDYTCQRLPASAGYLYGEVGASGPDFTNFPFCIVSSPRGTMIFTESAGSYNVAISAVVTSPTKVFETIVRGLAGAKKVSKLDDADVAIVTITNSNSFEIVNLIFNLSDLSTPTISRTTDTINSGVYVFYRDFRQNVFSNNVYSLQNMAALDGHPFITYNGAVSKNGDEVRIQTSSNVVSIDTLVLYSLGLPHDGDN